MLLIWIPPYIADYPSEWCPWWSVVFVVPRMNSKDPRDTFSSFCLWLQSYLERDVLEWRNCEVTRSNVGCCLPSQGALTQWGHHGADRQTFFKHLFLDLTSVTYNTLGKTTPHRAPTHKNRALLAFTDAQVTERCYIFCIDVEVKTQETLPRSDMIPQCKTILQVSIGGWSLWDFWMFYFTVMIFLVLIGGTYYVKYITNFMKLSLKHEKSLSAAICCQNLEIQLKQ